MITVAIFINDKVLIKKSALRKSDPNKNGFAKYETDCKQHIYHNPKDGAAVLSRKLLDLVEIEPARYDMSDEDKLKKLMEVIKNKN